MSLNNLIRVDVIDLLHTDDELEKMTEATKEAEALNEVINLFFEITERMHRILDIEQKQGFLTDAQHKKLFADVNEYGDIRIEVVHRNTPKPMTNKSSNTNAPITYDNDANESNDNGDLYIKTTPRKKATNFSFEMF